MKSVVFAIVLSCSSAGTAKIMFDLMQEVMGSLMIPSHENYHQAHLAIIKALETGDHEKALVLARDLEQYDQELMNILVSTLESGSYTFWTEENVAKGRAYIEENFGEKR